jgi:cell pole-organizing protein PopZ
MTAANPVQTAEDAAEAGLREASNEASREPSMEEILISIRRLIAQDQALFAADSPSTPEGARIEAAGSDDGDQGAAPVHGLRQAIEAEFRRPYAEPASGGGEVAEGAKSVDQPLVSPATDSAVGAAFNALVASRFAQNPDAILAMTREALRPLLESWLDAHLPALVERLVSAEIERIAKGG